MGGAVKADSSLDVTWPDVEAALHAVDPASVGDAPWFRGGGGHADRIAPTEAFDLGAGAALAIGEVRQRSGPAGRYLLPLERPAEGGPLRLAAAGEGVWRALATAIAEGRTIPALPRGRSASGAPGPITAALVCRPASGLGALMPGGARAIEAAPHRALVDGQSSTSVVLGERLLLKAYRRVEDGLSPDLELNAWLAEEVRFGAVPVLAGYAEIVDARGAATTAVLREHVEGGDAWTATTEQLIDWILAPGEVTVEFATEIAAGMGELTAELHVALAAGPDVPGFEVREASREELRAWRRDGQRQLQRALDLLGGDEAGRGLRALAPVIAEQLSVFEAVASVPLVARVHGDFDLRHVLLTADGPRIVDFDGDPALSVEERRRPASPLRDAAAMLRSLDSAGRRARRDAELRGADRAVHSGLDVDAWLRRARERYVGAYRAELRARGDQIDLDEDLLRAWELDRECRELVRAANLSAPASTALDGMRALVAEAGRG